MCLGLRRIHHPEPAHIFVAASPAPQLPWRHSPLRQMPEEDFLSEVEKRYGALPREVISDPEMRALVVPSLRADFAIIETYKYLPDPPLHCDLTAFGGLQDPMVKQSELEAWREQATGRFRLQMLDGNHLFLKSCRAQLLESIAGELNACCEDPQASSAFR